MRRVNKRKGFSLIELVIVIGIIAVLAAVLVPSLWSSMTSSKEKADHAAIENLSTTIQAGMQNSKIFKDARQLAEKSTDNRIDFVYALNEDDVLEFQSCEMWTTNAAGGTIKVTNFGAGGAELQALSMEIKDYVNGRVEPITIQSDYYKDYAYKITIQFTDIDFKVKSSWEMIDKTALPSLNCNHPSTTTEYATPSCDEVTYNVTTCTVCGHQEFEEVQPVGHELTYSEIAPTCQQNGSRTSVCSRCDYENVEVIPMTSHNFSTVTIDATCTEKGSVQSKCLVCGEIKASQELPALGHNLKEETIKDPTCTTTGTRQFSCTRCEHTATEPIAARGHQYSVITYPANCTDSGKEITKCTRCEHVKQELTTMPLGHIFDSGTITQEPTLETPGIKTYTCARCHITKQETVEHALSHSGYIPANATYYQQYFDETTYQWVGNILGEGQPFPSVQIGDRYVYGDYTYVYGGTIGEIDERYQDENGFDRYTIDRYNAYRYKNTNGTMNIGHRYAESTIFSVEDCLVEGWGVYAHNETALTYEQPLAKINGSDIIQMNGTYAGCTQVTDLRNIEISTKIKDVGNLFSGCEKLVYPSTLHNEITNMNRTFYHCPQIRQATISQKATDLESAFGYCTNLTTITTPIPETVQNISYTFFECQNLSGNIRINCDLTKVSNLNKNRTFASTQKAIHLQGDLANKATLKALSHTATAGNVTYDHQYVQLVIINQCQDVVTIDASQLQNVEGGYSRIELTPIQEGYTITQFRLQFTGNEPYESYTMNNLVSGATFLAPEVDGTIVISEVKTLLGAQFSSEHNPYPNNLDNVVYGEYYNKDAISMTVKLNIETERTDFDYVSIYDQFGNLVIDPIDGDDRFGDEVLRHQTIIVPGNYVKITFTTDYSSNEFYGFDATVTPNFQPLSQVVSMSKEGYINNMHEQIGFSEFEGASLLIIDMEVDIEPYKDFVYIYDEYGNEIPYCFKYDDQDESYYTPTGTYRIIVESDYVNFAVETDSKNCGAEEGSSYTGFTATITPVYENVVDIYQLDCYENNASWPLEEELLYDGAQSLTLYYMTSIEGCDKIPIHEDTTHGTIIKNLSGYGGGIIEIDDDSFGIGLITDGSISWEDGYIQHEGCTIWIVPHY